jgi:hypothetical protein
LMPKCAQPSIVDRERIPRDSDDLPQWDLAPPWGTVFGFLTIFSCLADQCYFSHWAFASHLTLFFVWFDADHLWPSIRRCLAHPPTQLILVLFLGP